MLTLLRRVVLETSSSSKILKLISLGKRLTSHPVPLTVEPVRVFSWSTRRFIKRLRLGLRAEVATVFVLIKRVKRCRLLGVGLERLDRDTFGRGARLGIYRVEPVGCGCDDDRPALVSPVDVRADALIERQRLGIGVPVGVPLPYRDHDGLRAERRNAPQSVPLVLPWCEDL